VGPIGFEPMTNGFPQVDRSRISSSPTGQAI
jgi:hypothetical protein